MQPSSKSHVWLCQTFIILPCKGSRWAATQTASPKMSRFVHLLAPRMCRSVDYQPCHSDIFQRCKPPPNGLPSDVMDKRALHRPSRLGPLCSAPSGHLSPPPAPQQASMRGVWVDDPVSACGMGTPRSQSRCKRTTRCMIWSRRRAQAQMPTFVPGPRKTWPRRTTKLLTRPSQQ
ncbi:hypothetical protein LY76DRAFT_352903 [Colletotrichum caudatum]|nr:hypothetical protein LY76DRAFT_352903 [Colletotrichum caudatum]